MPGRLRRWTGRLGVAAILLVTAAGVGWWVAGGRLTEAALARLLPLRLGDGLVLDRLVADPAAGPRPQVVITATPARARELVGAALARPVPPGAIRDGLTLDGRLDHPALVPQLPLSLRVQADAGLPAPPLVEARLPTAGVNALLARWCAEAYAAGELPVATVPALDPGATIEDAGDAAERDGALERRLRVVASGWVDLGGDRVRVRAFSGIVVFACEAESKGYAIVPRLEIERLDYDAPDGWLLRPTKEMIAALINGRLDRDQPLRGVLLPLWTPFDLRLRARIEGAAPAPLPAAPETY